MRKVALLKRRHNKIKRRIELGVEKPGDIQQLQLLRTELGYK